MGSYRGNILWWGRSNPEYSRNRIIIKLLKELGWNIEYFYPHFSAIGDFEANLLHIKKPDLVWLPCFRQRDMTAALRWSIKASIPLIADP